MGLGGPLAASVALHAVILAAIGPGGSGSASPDGFPSPIEVRLAATPVETSAPLRAAKPAATPRAGAFSGPARIRYFKSSEVDERAVPIELPALIYPEFAYHNRLPGVVRLRVFISGDGQVVRTDVVDAAPAGQFEKAAIEAVEKTRFHPARKDGRFVASQKLLEIGFDPYAPPP
jgi:TonB family protein